MNSQKLQKLHNFVIFQSEEGKVNIDVFFADETLWLTQKLMAKLFDTTPQNITLHLSNIYSEGELQELLTCKEFLQVQPEGRRNVQRIQKFYSLDAIIAVGYRVNSKRATKFRIWATKVLQEFIIKGFVLDDERLKQIKHFGQDYFEELLERIREIRASERHFYQKITDIYALSADYDSTAEITKDFFATVQNKLHWAITGQTAAEIIFSHADANKPYMGMTTWKRAPKGKILKSDALVAKNYLSKKNIIELNGLVSAYLDLAENRARRGIVMNMQDWVKFLNRFLDLSEYPVLTHLGKVSAEQARVKAEAEYEVFRVVQDKAFESDFDKEVKKLRTLIPRDQFLTNVTDEERVIMEEEKRTTTIKSLHTQKAGKANGE